RRAGPLPRRGRRRRPAPDPPDDHRPDPPDGPRAAARPRGGTPVTATTSTPVGVFARLTGQEAVAEELLRAARDPASMTHAWLFTGPAGSGRARAARAFAAARQCESGPAEGGPGCGRCQACQTVLAGSHPDLVVESTTGTFILVG